MDNRHAGREYTEEKFNSAVEEIVGVGTRLEVKIIGDRYEQTQEQIWDLEGVIEEDPDNGLAEQELQRKIEKKIELGKKLDLLEQKAYK